MLEPLLAAVPDLMVAVEAVEEPTESGLLVVAALAAIAFVVGQVTKRFMSEVIVFMAIGIVAGPELLAIIDPHDLTMLEPVVSLALGTIVFGIGERLEIPRLRHIRHTLAPISLLENLATFGLVFLAVIAVGGDVAVAFLLAAIGLSTSPTTLVAVIAERRASGSLTDHLLAATALNNVASAVLFGLGLPVVLAARSSSGATQGLLAFVQLVLASLLIGGVGGFLLRRWMERFGRAGERLLFVVVVLVGVVATSRAIGAPVVISTLVMGAVVANDDRDTTPLFGALRILEAPIFLVFFLVAGAAVHIQELATVGLVGTAFVIGRLAGKIGGGWLGADLTRSGRGTGWAPWIGVGLQPFAGMAIGLAAFTLERATNAGLPGVGADVSAIVLGSVVVFELLGPFAVGRALERAGETGTEADQGEAHHHPVRHILAPVSSHEMARRKGGQIVDLAASASAILTGLHIVPRGTTNSDAGDPALTYLRQLAANRGARFEPVVVESDSVVDAIVATARRSAVDLVVLGEPIFTPDQPGDGWHIIHEVTRQLEDEIRVLVVPTMHHRIVPSADPNGS